VVTSDSARLGQEKRGFDVWTVNKSDLRGNAPVISVTSAATDGREAAVPACAIEITKLQGDASDGNDWRIGFSVPDVGPLADKTIRVSMPLKAADDVVFDSGEVYVYDGVRVGSVALGRLTPEWRTISLAYRPAPGATRIEVWLRLILKGTISRRTTVYLGETRLDLETTP